MTVLCSIAAMLLPCWGASALIAAGMRHVPRNWATCLLRFCLSVGVGAGLSSCTYFLWLVAFGRPQGAYLAVETLFWCLVVFVCRANLQSATNAAVASNNRSSLCESQDRVLNRTIAGLFATILAIALAGLAGQALAHPEGGWDAWAIWNLRARFLFHLGDDWRQALDSAFEHPDYPLLVSGSLARWWTFVGHDADWVGPFFGVAFTLATVGAVVAAIGLRRGRNMGLLAGVVLLGTVRLLRWGASQYADIPLAFYMAATLLLLTMHDEIARERSPKAGSGLLVLAGVMAGLSAWTKNEGLLFFIVVICVRATVVWFQCGLARSVRESAKVLAAAAPVLFVVLLFKSQVPAANDLAAAQGFAETTGRLLDPARHVAILKAFAGVGIQVAHVLAAVVLIGVLLLGKRRSMANGNRDILLASGIIGMMLAGYYVAYLATPYELDWHLATSLDRLFVQLVPMAAYAAFLQWRTPDEILAPISAIRAFPIRQQESLPAPQRLEPEESEAFNLAQFLAEM
ncbi:MAG TPA: phospholipid carrier-dependent glycosyltransferase [Planctomycetaceae bacterium]|nr:phospholipid carrier-dependent glycosyltransferase [Planctomycetaceae bacterium]